MTYPSFLAGDILTATDMNAVGMWRVVPSSATNGTVAANGAVTVGNAVASVTVSGCFSSSYRNYKILYTGGTGTSGAWLSLNFNGTPAVWVGNLYYANFANGGVLTVGMNNAANCNYVGGCIGGVFDANIEIRSPNQATRTFLNAPFIDANNAGQTVACLNNATSYTGFILTPNTGTLTAGTITVYGYN